MGVNKIVQVWNGENMPWYSSEVAKECADELREIARTAWHPITDPPIEEDGDDLGQVLVAIKDRGYYIRMMHWVEVFNDPMLNRFDEWARICDVVLMPQGDE